MNVNHATLTELFKLFDGVAGLRFHHAGCYFYTRSPIKFSFFNSVVVGGGLERGRIGAPAPQVLVKQMLDDARRRNVPQLWWIIHGTGNEHDWATALQNQGALFADQLVSMRLERVQAPLETLDPKLWSSKQRDIFQAQDISSGIVEQQPSFHQPWVATLSKVFDIPTLYGEQFLQASLQTGQGVNLCFTQTATPAEAGASETESASPDALRHEGDTSEVLCTASLLCGPKHAAIYNIATALPHRRRGLGKLITMNCLQQAWQAGYEQVHLEATPDGAPLYRQLGFQDQGLVWRFQYFPPAS